MAKFLKALNRGGRISPEGSGNSQLAIPARLIRTNIHYNMFDVNRILENVNKLFGNITGAMPFAHPCIVCCWPSLTHHSHCDGDWQALFFIGRTRNHGLVLSRHCCDRVQDERSTIQFIFGINWIYWQSVGVVGSEGRWILQFFRLLYNTEMRAFRIFPIGIGEEAPFYGKSSTEWFCLTNFSSTCWLSSCLFLQIKPKN